MKVIDRIKNAIIDDDFFISIYKNHIYVINYDDIIDFGDNKIKLRINENIFFIYGRDFKLIRKNNKELDITGFFSKMETNNE